MKYKTIKEAVGAWITEMNMLPTAMIEKLMSYDPDEWLEVTTPARCDRVYVYDCEETGEIASIITDNGNVEYEVKLDSGKTVMCNVDDYEVDREGTLPMWGSMWQFGDSCDNWWLEENDGIRLMSECGFRIYYHDEFGYFFGIDGAGYSFYEEHWIPAYKARGLHWHEEEANE